MSAIDWDGCELSELFEEVRRSRTGPDGEKTIWAFEQMLNVARIDDGLLEYVLVAVVCLLARAEDCPPREVLEAFWRRSVSDDEWQRLRPLFG